MKSLLVYCVLSVVLFSTITTAVVVGIDYGSQWYKIALVKPGSFDIVLNEQSSRKTHTLVGWNRGERFFGSDAFNLLQRNPSQVYSFVSSLLGKTINHPSIEVNNDWFAYSIAEDPDRNTIGIKHDANTTFSPEELNAMILRNAKVIATAGANGASVKDCVITVPPWLTHHERQALIDAAELAGFNVLSLINDITAFALSYAKDRTFDNNTHNVIFYDIGATSAKAIMVTFQSIADVKAKKNKTIAQVLVRSTAWDETLGGRFLDQKLANHFKQAIHKKYPDVDLNNQKLTLRLLKEAAKAKEILSANQQTHALLQGLGDHDDISLPVTRTEFEEIAQEFWDRALNPIKAVLAESEIPKEEVRYIEIVGGTTRIPKIQSILKEFMDRSELDKHVNGDEGAATGAAFYAAGLSSQFRVKEVRVRDLTNYPINVRINLAQNQEPTISTAEEEVDKIDTDTTLFRQNSRLNTRKGLTFYTYSNFTLDLMYDQSDPKYTIPKGSEPAIMQIAVLDVPTYQKYNLTSKPKIHASFLLSSSAVLSLAHIEAEVTTILYTPKKKANITIPAKEEETIDKSDTENNDTIEEAETENVPEQAPTDTAATQEDTEEQEELEAVKKTHTIPLKAVLTHTGIKPVDSAFRKAYENTLAHFDKLDAKRRELQQERNALESYLYDTRDKLENGDVITASTEDERDAITTELSSLDDWLMEHDEDATVAEYRAKLKVLKEKTDKIYFRISEKDALPVAVDELKSTISLSTKILGNITDVLNVTEEERDRVLKVVATAEDWLATKMAEQATLANHKDPVITSSDVARKRADIELQTKLLLRKPKKKPVVVDAKDANEKEATNDESQEQTNTDQPEPETETDTNPEPETANTENETDNTETDTQDTETQKDEL